MKQNRIFLIVASVAIAFIVAFMPQNAYAETSSTSEQLEWVVPIFLPDIASFPELNNENWIDLAELPTSDRPESSFQGFLLPHINAVYARHKSIIESLTADCSIILVDYKEATKDDVTSLSFDQIVAIAICGPQVRIATTSALIPGNNPALISADLMEFVALAKEAGYNK
ncbi:MAG: hypothetical protein J1E63_00595 [Muribaculaceae bacterium]|nr:hypothetical protein [Muribaculaceae bacterium]